MDNTPGGTSEPEQPSTAGSEDPFDIVLDDDFIKAAAAKEQSARTRELTAKWAKQPPTQTGWRTDGPSAFRAPDPQESQPQKAAKKPKTKRRGSGSSRIVLRNAAAGGGGDADYYGVILCGAGLASAGRGVGITA